MTPKETQSCYLCCFIEVKGKYIYLHILYVAQFILHYVVMHKAHRIVGS